MEFQNGFQDGIEKKMMQKSGQYNLKRFKKIEKYYHNIWSN
jgi:hypothetical protein